MKLKDEILKQARQRLTALKQVKVIEQMAQQEFKLFMASKIQELGLPKEKQYDVNFETGEIFEVKTEAIKDKNE